jgi:FkbH-like protein
MSEKVRCLVWDLDNTLWSGTLLESETCRLRPGVRRLLLTLNARGILLSVASTNDYDHAMSVLRQKRIAELFLHPQIGWTNKVSSIRTISDRLQIGLDSVGFIDDEPYELEQVRRMLPAVRTYPADSYRSLIDRPEFNPGVITEESRTRRIKYLQALEREREANSRGMSRQQFLEYCQTRMAVRRGTPADVPRILELMQRSHQLNSTGVVYDAEQVESFISDPTYRVYVVELQDRFVDYGRVGVAVCRPDEGIWHLTSFLFSCRVLNRGISGYFLAWLRGQALREGASEFRACYKRSSRNHRMKTLYQVAGFTPLHHESEMTVYTCRPANEPEPPHWLTVDARG